MNDFTAKVRDELDSLREENAQLKAQLEQTNSAAIKIDELKAENEQLKAQCAEMRELLETVKLYQFSGYMEWREHRDVILKKLAVESQAESGCSSP